MESSDSDSHCIITDYKKGNRVIAIEEGITNTKKIQTRKGGYRRGRLYREKNSQGWPLKSKTNNNHT